MTDGDLPAALDAALNRFGLHPSTDEKWRAVPPWYVVDESHADPDVGYPGDFVSEHATHEEARRALMKVALQEIEVLPR